MEVSKSKSIGEMTVKELGQLTERLSLEKEVSRLIFVLRRNSGELYDPENPPVINSDVPVGQLYHGETELKDKTINQMTMGELGQLRDRLTLEQRAQDLIYDRKRQSGEVWDYDLTPVVDTITPVNQLYHFGTPGMRWGVRKARTTGQSNHTSAVKSKKPGSTKSEATGKSKKTGTVKPHVPKAEDFMESRRFKSKAVAGLSTPELKKLNERLNLEKQFKDLTKDERQKGKNFLSESLSSGLKQTTTTVVAASSLWAVKRAIEKQWGTDTVTSMFPAAKKKS